MEKCDMWLLITFKCWSCVGCFLDCVSFPGFMKSEPFSPDAAALQSILQNEGVKAGGCLLLPTTPRNPIRPSGRGTSVYTVCVGQSRFWWILTVSTWIMFLIPWLCPQAQRVPARKQQAEAARGPASKDSDMIFAYYETWISFPLMCECCFHSPQLNAKSLRAWNGLHKESLTPDLSPCLLWSVESWFVCLQPVQLCS